jgi:hypothetical protein
VAARATARAAIDRRGCGIAGAYQRMILVCGY